MLTNLMRKNKYGVKLICVCIYNPLPASYNDRKLSAEGKQPFAFKQNEVVLQYYENSFSNSIRSTIFIKY